MRISETHSSQYWMPLGLSYFFFGGGSGCFFFFWRWASFSDESSCQCGPVWLLGNVAPRSLAELRTGENRRVMEDGKLEGNWLILAVLVLFFVWGFCCGK